MPLARFVLFLLAAALPIEAGAQVGRLPLTADFSVEGVTYNPEIPTPDQVIGHTVGSSHTRPDQLVDYFEAVARASDRVRVARYATSYENRPLVYAVVSTSDRVSNLESARLANRGLADNPDEVSDADIRTLPTVVAMHYSIHGNEASGSEASMLLLYHLAAGQGQPVKDILDAAVVIIDPTQNPDGRNRFVDWVNQNRGGVANADTNDREHLEPWPEGRTNHYFFDLNRDWLPVQHPETQGRVALFYDWRPQVVVDIHEMGSDRTFFFQPGVPSRTNPNTPARTVDLTTELSRYTAGALDEIGSFYYTRETFDDFYYGKGSTYPDINGSVGILFEQGSSRALLRDTDFGILDYGFTVRNQLAASIGVIEGAVALREKLLRNQRDFYSSAPDEGRRSDINGWLVGGRSDVTRTDKLVETLLRHQVEIYRLRRPVTAENERFLPDVAYIIPAEQPQYRFVKAAFERVTTFRDSVFYDVSAWSLPLAFGVQHAAYRGDVGPLKGGVVTSEMLQEGRIVDVPETAFAYVIEGDSYYLPRAIQRFQVGGILPRLALDAFQLPSEGALKRFERGSVIIPSLGRGVDIPADEVHELVSEAARSDRLRISPVSTALTPVGTDLGSPRVTPLSPKKVALITGPGTEAYRVGEVWHLITERMNIPVSLIDTSRADDIEWWGYDVVVMVDGEYESAPMARRLSDWVKRGGRLIAIQRAAKWAVDSGIAEAYYEVDEPVERTRWVRFEDKAAFGQEREVTGAIVEVQLDSSHPIAFGLDQRVAAFRSNELILKPPVDPGETVGVYTREPLLSGYVHPERQAALGATAAVVVRKSGEGRVVLMQDTPTFRAFWYGTDTLLLNAIMFAEAY